MIDKKAERQLLRIAMQHMAAVAARGNLETVNMASEDFINVSVWGLKAALEAACELGKEAAACEQS